MAKFGHKLMKQTSFIIFFFIFLVALIPKQIYAQSADFNSQSVVSMEEENKRIQILSSYLSAQNSPLAGNAKDFIESATKYNLDWRLLPSIAGVESSFGLAEPIGSYNSFGFGIYGNNYQTFSSYKNAIDTVAKTLSQTYIGQYKAQNIYQIGSLYATSPTWAQKVIYYMNDIE